MKNCFGGMRSAKCLGMPATRVDAVELEAVGWPPRKKFFSLVFRDLNNKLLQVFLPKVCRSDVVALVASGTFIELDRCRINVGQL